MQYQLGVARFNSRTPGGVRHGNNNDNGHTATVSIHAPREGCDSASSDPSKSVIVFQFTHPGRGATWNRRHSYSGLGFQFTHPGRGATEGQCLHSHHACSFNSRTPGGVRQWSLGECIDAPEFQFTHPGRGATFRTVLRRRRPKFQFTHPGRGATPKDYFTGVVPSVSIHAPREGCDNSYGYYPALASCFNSRTPGGVRLIINYPISMTSIVSIHAPREGCDFARSRAGRPTQRFQFTHPGRGATVWCKVAYYRADKQA